MHTLANSKVPDDAAFHQDLHCLLAFMQSSWTEYLTILTCNALISTMDYPKFTISKRMKEFISIQRVKLMLNFSIITSHRIGGNRKHS